jgi:gas vesicle protein
MSVQKKIDKFLHRGHSRMSTKNYWLAFGIGVSAGAAVALLYAPQSGVRTRRKLRKGMGEAGDYLQDAGDYLKSQAERFSEEAQDAVKRARVQAVHLVDRAGDQASDVVDSVSGVVQGAVKSAKALV